MRALKRLLLAISVVAVAVPSAAQLGGGYDGEQFVHAIKEGKNDDAFKLLQEKPILVNARDLSGMTALVTAIEGRNREWAGYLLQKGADPNLPSAGGETPLMAAARTGSQEIAEWLIGMDAKVNAQKRSGETALIIAVQQRQLPIVRLLLNAGADPDHSDSVAGYSARDYAKRDSRTPEILRAIEAKKPTR